MNLSRNKKIALGIIALLIVITGLCVYKYIGSGSQEIKTAKAYISKLIDAGLIDDNVNMKKSKSSEKSDPSKAEKYYSVTVDNYAIDMDANYNVIGFTNKNSAIKDDTTIITEDEAKGLAEEYMKGLYTGECQYKETVKEEDSQKVPYYTFVFYKCKDDIPLYNYIISMKINKETGKVDGFSNSTKDVEPTDATINITPVQAEQIVKDSFSKLNTFINFDDRTQKYFYENKDQTDLELCYMVSVKGLDSSSKEIRMKYFVSTDTGEIVNTEKNNV
ncbi:MAG: hypothetical protein K5986_11195 [Clostridium sp.]|uniref:YcdB/YcdC domain-containing protein n=1 Tax=Clostridium sp. DSM 8431 TaxID=1761781 RepID=UPI0008EB0307|nr:YcdB/YcdC domain-containing protein [Clostridium sp. DSM 8431]MCR4944980.1 hypothetical protein [Clostridium sp.]SFU33807.1 hypothetical protein SAMN04487886_100921 [Clostridium sp. DSM 8431]